MLKINESRNFTATSVIEKDGVATQVAYMNATVPQDGNISVNSAIQNQDLFTAYRNEVLADIRAFEDMVYATE